MPRSPRSPDATRDAFRAHERFVWGLCYRMTGSAADADDLVQETFARVIEHPPPRGDPAETWRPWLVRIAVNLARDALRARRRRGYVGPWLPSPVEIDEAAIDPATRARDDAEARYASMESVSIAFLVALEALTPQQRAVLLLRDVFDFSVRDVADALRLSEGAVKVTHHRARAAMRGYDEARTRPTPQRTAETRAALERFLVALGSEDVAAVAATLAPDARALTDGGGEFSAARRPIDGAAKIALFFLKTSRGRTMLGAELRMVNGAPAVVARFGDAPPIAPRSVLACDIDGDGRITRIYTMMHTPKLTAIRFP